MKRLVAFVLVLLIAFSVGISSAGEEVSGTKTIDNEKVKTKTIPVEEVLDPNRSISLYINYGETGIVYYGDTITIHTNIQGFDNVPYTLQWQESRDGGITWNDIAGETSDSYSFILSHANATYMWRVFVNYPDEIEVF